MGDPFSVAGSAVGVISVGLQVCQGLASYINKYKSADKEMRDFGCQIEGLDLILQGLRDILTGTGGIDPPVADKFKVALRMITDCESAIQELDGTLSKLQTGPSQAAHGVFPALKTASKRALYPFRRDTLVGLLGVLDGLQENLDTALALLQMALNLDSKTRIVSMQQSTVDIVANTHQALILAQGIEQRHNDMDQILSRLDQRMEQMQSTISHYSPRNLPEPSTLRSLCDKQKKVEHDMNAFVMLQSRSRRIKKVCVCVATGGFFSVVTHEPGCPHFIPYKTVKSIQSQYRICNSLLRYSIIISLRITTGAGGFAISPNIAFHAAVADSPAFILVRDNMRRFELKLLGSYIAQTPHELYGPQDFTNLRVELLRLYHEGKASPTDVNLAGKTVFHDLAQLIGLALLSENEAIVQGAHRLLMDLLSSITLPTTVDASGRTFADALSFQLSNHTSSIDFLGKAKMMPRPWINCFALIMDRGGHMTHTTFDSKWCRDPEDAAAVSVRFEFANQVMKYTRNGDVNVPEILEPLMLHDEVLLHSLLRTPAFLACSEIPTPYIHWPEGLRILLQSGKLPMEHSLEHACSARLSESVTLLLAARSFCIQPIHLKSAVWGQNFEIMSLIVRALVEERRELQFLAENHLSSEELASLHLNSDTLLDYHAGRAYDLLQASGVILPDWGAESDGWLVYASIRDDCEMAALLWDGGFKDVNETDIQGCTSLMFCENSKFAEWLISHSADIHRRVWGIPAIHFMAGMLRLDSNLLDSSGEASLRTFGLLLQEKSQDGCDCPCSLAGCFAITRRLCKALSYSRVWCDVTHRWSVISDLVLHLEEEDVPRQAALAIIRVLTFEVLQIPHTCCHPNECWGTVIDCKSLLHSIPFYHWKPKDQEEIDEIHDEWREKIAQLEVLVTEFQARYETSNRSFCQFLETIWLEEMRKIDKADNAPSQEDVRRVRELGVILDEVDKDSSQDEVDEEEWEPHASSS